MMSETKEWYFFKYAYPCMYVLVQQGTLRKEELAAFDALYAHGEAPSREVLERTHVEAFRRMKELASGKNTDVWDWGVLKAYWEDEEHNEFIERRDGNYAKFDQAFCTMCKVNQGIVLQKERTTEGTVLTVRDSEGENKFMQGKYLEARVGDRVLTHLAYAVQLAR